jgi:hypothetical protein
LDQRSWGQQTIRTVGVVVQIEIVQTGQ